MSRPPQRRLAGGIPAPSPADDRDAFIAGAPAKATLPWQRPHVRDDLHMQLNTRMPERLMLQIEWLAREAVRPKRDLIEEALADYVARELKRRGVDA